MSPCPNVPSKWAEGLGQVHYQCGTFAKLRTSCPCEVEFEGVLFFVEGDWYIHRIAISECFDVRTWTRRIFFLLFGLLEHEANRIPDTSATFIGSCNKFCKRNRMAVCPARKRKPSILSFSCRLNRFNRCSRWKTTSLLILCQNMVRTWYIPLHNTRCSVVANQSARVFLRTWKHFFACLLLVQCVNGHILFGPRDDWFLAWWGGGGGARRIDGDSRPDDLAGDSGAGWEEKHNVFFSLAEAAVFEGAGEWKLSIEARRVFVAIFHRSNKRKADGKQKFDTIPCGAGGEKNSQVSLCVGPDRPRAHNYFFWMGSILSFFFSGGKGLLICIHMQPLGPVIFVGAGETLLDREIVLCHFFVFSNVMCPFSFSWVLLTTHDDGELKLNVGRIGMQMHTACVSTTGFFSDELCS